MIEAMKWGNPDRFVNCYEAVQLAYTPVMMNGNFPVKGGPNTVNSWGVTMSFPANVPGMFPVHDKEHIVIKDIEHWRDYVKPPKVVYDEDAWAPFVNMVNAIDRKEYFVAPFMAPGIFEQCHYLLEISNCLVSLYTNPDEMHEIIDMLTDWELRYAEEIVKYLKPDAIFHHDDWGSQLSSFMSPDMFEEFILPAYKQVYGYFKKNGVECIIHHSDSYGMNLVDYMVEMGMDVWQGVMTTNDIPGLVKKYAGKLTFMGGIDNGKVDMEGWSRETIHNYVFDICKKCGPKGFIPCTTMGGAESLYPGVYETVMEEIALASKELL
jgi:hypothetical protein